MSKRLNIVIGGNEVDGLLGWGVLQRLLEEDDIEIEAISAAGSGCLSAIALGQGLAQNGREGAADRLGSIWREVVASWTKSVNDPEPWQMLMPLLAAAQQAEDTATGDPFFFSPEDINPLDLNPTWDIAKAYVPDPAQRTIPIFLSAVNVNTGSKRIFAFNEITHDAVRAATCAPWRNAAVQIDGEYFWGADVNAAPLYPLFGASAAQDYFCIIPRMTRESRPPGSGEAIASRLAALMSLGALQAELRVIELVQRLTEDGVLNADLFAEPKVHGTVIPPIGTTWPSASALYADPDMSTALYDHGYTSTAAWLAQNKSGIGVRNTLDIRSLL